MRTMVGRRVCGAAMCWLAAACAQNDPSPGLAGYNHAFAHSRFHVGAVSSERDELGMHKVIGDVGTFSTQLVTGAVVALPDVPFPDPSFGVYPGNADDQNAAVLSYFVTAGLPAEQVGSVTANESGFVQGQYALRGWWSVLNREYDGVLIQDSIATAAFDAQGQASAEQVYWPRIPLEVLEEVNLLRQVLSDPRERAAYVAALPASSREAILVVRHTSWFWKGPFKAAACCRGLNAGSVCFDRSGQLVHLPDEEQ